MKKIFNLPVIALLSVFVLSSAMQMSFTPLNAQSKKDIRTLQKARDKMYKQRKKELNQEGWKVSGSNKTLDVLLLEYYQKLNSGDNYEIVGEVSSCQSINVCKQAALNNATIEYAGRARSYVMGRIASDLQLDQTSGEGEFDKMYAAYERLVSAEVKGVLQQSFSIVREKSKGLSEYKAFFIIDEEAATKARVRAIENALKETQIAQEYASQIGDFVKEGFE